MSSHLFDPITTTKGRKQERHRRLLQRQLNQSLFERKPRTVPLIISLSTTTAAKTPASLFVVDFDVPPSSSLLE
jgi:hypothetical protein